MTWKTAAGLMRDALSVVFGEQATYTQLYGEPQSVRVILTRGVERVQRSTGIVDVRDEIEIGNHLLDGAPKRGALFEVGGERWQVDAIGTDNGDTTVCIVKRIK
jgi:hypothetical protein